MYVHLPVSVSDPMACSHANYTTLRKVVPIKVLTVCPTLYLEYKLRSNSFLLRNKCKFHLSLNALKKKFPAFIWQ